MNQIMKLFFRSRHAAIVWLAWGMLALGLAAFGTPAVGAQVAVSSPAGAVMPDIAPAQARLPVVASFSILADMVREVGGDDIALSVIVGPLSDAHTFEPTPQDARALGAARVLILNGLGFESWLPRLLQASGFTGSEVVASQGVVSLPHDPHAWQDLGNGVIYVQNIAQGLAQADPAHAAAYRARAQAYIGQLRQADADWRRQLDAVPQDRRVLATSHDAFGYFAAAYGIRVLSVVGLSGEAEPSARAMADLIRQIRSEHIRSLFLEQGGNARAIRQLASETGVKLGGTLYADTLDRPGHQADTYLGMFRWNTRQLLQSFTAP